ncbi:MAG TPA: anhydro-N-acetylmuramic acid kinase, partial [Armatimonadetes bacterium]|nr:anhydro-N-acetylmuramic acid kinase [Armatimonadota bacterium]
MDALPATCSECDAVMVWRAIESYVKKSERRVVGLISGTSADGIDAALVRISGMMDDIKIVLDAFITESYPDDVRDAIRALRSGGNAIELCRMNYILGELFAEACLKLLHRCGLSPSDIDLIGSHGQTIYHLPPRGDNSFGATLQIGEGCVIAERTGIMVVCDFRSRDIAAGGQGAPLVPYVDYLLFRSELCNRVCLNIGGIANVTFLPQGVSSKEVIAFDTGPGNCLIDRAIQHFSGGQSIQDVDGALAARGRVCEELLNDMLAHPFVKLPPPKSTDPEEFTGLFNRTLKRASQLGLSDADTIATITAFTAITIAHACERFWTGATPINEVLV